MLWPQKSLEKAKLPDIELKGFRVVLRPVRLSDYPDWYEVRSRNEARLRKYEPKWADDALTCDFFERRIERQIREWTAGRAYCFVIIDKESGKLIGGMNLNNICRGAVMAASLGYWIDQKYEGLGYMAEAGRLIKGFAFKKLELRRINAACLPENTRSQNLLLNLGFEKEGFAKSYLQINGRWQDHVLFGLCAPGLDGQ